MDAMDTVGESHVNGELSNGDLSKDEKQLNSSSRTFDKDLDGETSCPKPKDGVDLKLSRNGDDFHEGIKVKLGCVDKDSQIHEEQKVDDVPAHLADGEEEALTNGELIDDLKDGPTNGGPLEKEATMAPKEGGTSRVHPEECNQELSIEINPGKAESAEGRLSSEDPHTSAGCTGISVDGVASREGTPTRILPTRTQSKIGGVATRRASVDSGGDTPNSDATPVRKAFDDSQALSSTPNLDSLERVSSLERTPTRTLLAREGRTRKASTDSQGESSSKDRTQGQKSVDPKSRCSTREGTPTRNTSMETSAMEVSPLRDSSSEIYVNAPLLLENIEKIKKPRRGSRSSDISQKSLDTNIKSSVKVTVDHEKEKNSLGLVGGQKECVQETSESQKIGSLLDKQSKENLSSHLNHVDSKHEVREVNVQIPEKKNVNVSNLETSAVGSLSTPTAVVANADVPRKKRKYTRRNSTNKQGEKAGQSPKKTGAKNCLVKRKRVLNKSIDSCVENPKKRRNYAGKKKSQTDLGEKQLKRRSLPMKVVVAKDPEFQNSPVNQPKTKKKKVPTATLR